MLSAQQGPNSTNRKPYSYWLQRFEDFHNVQSVPKETTSNYMEELATMKETDPKTGAVFCWGSSADYITMGKDINKGDMLKRYIHAIIETAYCKKIFPTNLKDAQRLVDNDKQILTYVLTGDKNGSINVSASQEWNQQWSAIKAELSQIPKIELLGKKS